MERRAKVELFEQIRREYEFGVGTIKGVAHKLGVHRRMARQALANAEPPERKPVDRERPVIGPLRPFIDAILEADRNAPRKQRHTAHRIFERIRTELPEHKVAEVTVRLYVRERKRELGWSTRATCVPQSYAPGQEGQVDWYEAWAELGGARWCCRCSRCAAWWVARPSIARIIAPPSRRFSKPTSTRSNIFRASFASCVTIT
jgi:hypothetical protein